MENLYNVGQVPSGNFSPKKTNKTFLIFLTAGIAAFAAISLATILFLPEGSLPLTQKEPKLASQVTITITNTGFTPQTISIQKGDQVVWVNQSTNAHQIASDPHPTHEGLPELFSNVLAQGESFSFTFERAGRFTYHDHLNPLDYQGIVVVE